MNRRAFIRTAIGGVAAACGIPLLPTGATPVKKATLPKQIPWCFRVTSADIIRPHDWRQCPATVRLVEAAKLALKRQDQRAERMLHARLWPEATL